MKRKNMTNHGSFNHSSMIFHQKLRIQKEKKRKQIVPIITENEMDFKGSKMVFEQEDHYGKHLNVLKL